MYDAILKSSDHLNICGRPINFAGHRPEFSPVCKTNQFCPIRVTLRLNACRLVSEAMSDSLVTHTKYWVINDHHINNIDHCFDHIDHHI